MRLLTPKRGGQVAAFFEFAALVQLEQDGHVQAVRGLFEAFEPFGVEGGGDKQDGVRRPRRALIDLIFVDDEVLRNTGSEQVALACFRYSGAPWKYCSSVNTDRQAAPPRW